jgi:hypothetical protein
VVVEYASSPLPTPDLKAPFGVKVPPCKILFLAKAPPSLFISTAEDILIQALRELKYCR